MIISKNDFFTSEKTLLAGKDFTFNHRSYFRWPRGRRVLPSRARGHRAQGEDDLTFGNGARKGATRSTPAPPDQAIADFPRLADASSTIRVIASTSMNIAVAANQISNHASRKFDRRSSDAVCSPREFVIRPPKYW